MRNAMGARGDQKQTPTLRHLSGVCLRDRVLSVGGGRPSEEGRQRRTSEEDGRWCADRGNPDPGPSGGPTSRTARVAGAGSGLAGDGPERVGPGWSEVVGGPRDGPRPAPEDYRGELDAEDRTPPEGPSSGGVLSGCYETEGLRERAPGRRLNDKRLLKTTMTANPKTGTHGVRDARRADVRGARATSRIAHDLPTTTTTDDNQLSRRSGIGLYGTTTG